MLGSNHATDWRPVNGVVSTEDPANAESIVAITSSIHAMETGVNHPPYKSPLDLTENFTSYTIEDTYVDIDCLQFKLLKKRLQLTA